MANLNEGPYVGPNAQTEDIPSTLGQTLSIIDSAGSTGDASQVLSANGDGTVAWIDVTSGPQTQITGSAGTVDTTGALTMLAGPAREIDIATSGDPGAEGGAIYISANAGSGAGGSSNDIRIKTGNAILANSGSIYITTGTAVGGTPGNMNIQTAGDMTLTSGALTNLQTTGYVKVTGGPFIPDSAYGITGGSGSLNITSNSGNFTLRANGQAVTIGAGAATLGFYNATPVAPASAASLTDVAAIVAYLVALGLAV